MKQEQPREQQTAPISAIKNNQEAEYSEEKIQLNSNTYYITNSQLLSN